MHVVLQNLWIKLAFLVVANCCSPLFCWSCTRYAVFLRNFIFHFGGGSCLAFGLSMLPVALVGSFDQCRYICSLFYRESSSWRRLWRIYAFWLSFLKICITDSSCTLLSRRKDEPPWWLSPLSSNRPTATRIVRQPGVCVLPWWWNEACLSHCSCDVTTCSSRG